MSTGIRIAILAAVCGAHAVAAGAQPTPQPTEWSHGTTLSGFLGVAVDSERTGPALGGAVGWELTPRMAIEGSGAWLDRGRSPDTFTGALKFRAAMFGRDRAAPYLAAGIGLCRASYRADDDRVPSFYRRRMGRQGGPGARNNFTFMDPSVVVSGGVNIFATRHIAIRPDVEAAIVFRDGRRHVITTAVVHLAFHFEHHPVTPARRAAR